MVSRLPRARRAVRRVVAAAALFAAACAPADPLGPAVAGANTPAVGMNPGQFGFAVTARGWTADQTYAPDLATGALQVGLTVSGYRGGGGRVAVTDADGAEVFARDLAGDVAQGSNATVRGRAPFRVRVTASGYTGAVALGVNAAGG